MINVIYCPDETPKIVVAAGATVDLPSTHGDHVCLKVAGVDEDQPASYPHTATDSTVINNVDEWHTHLAQYIP